MKKRILGLFLCLVMCLSLIPTTALAATYTSSSTVALKDLSVGDIINGSMTLTNEALRDGEVVRPIWCEIYWLERSNQTATAAFAERVLINFPSNNPQTVQVPEKYSRVESWTIKELSPLDRIENRTIVVYPTNHSAHNFLYSAQSADTIMASCIATGCPLNTAPTFTLVAEDAVVSSKATYTATLSNWRDFSNHTDEVATPSIQYNMVIDGTIGAETTGNYIIGHVGTYCASVTFKDVTVRKNFNILASAPVAVTGVTLNETSASIVVGTTETLTAIVAPDNATNKNVTWTSSDEGVATVADGVVTAVAAGTATITATTVEGGFSATCTVTVTPVAVTGVTLNKTSASIVAGTTETLTATVAPDNATNKNVTWTSSNTSVATVDDAGVVTAVAAGTATITVTTEDGGKTATCEVTVPCSHGNTEVRDAIAATCNEAGYTGDTYCKDCGDKIADGTAIDVKAHTYGEWTTTKEPTETETGSKERTCSACGNKQTEEIPVLIHTHTGTLQSGTSATCTVAGVKDYYTCSCGKAFEDATCNIEIVDLDAWKAEGGNGYLAPKGHTYGGWTTTKEPTETETGSRERTCSACGNKDTGIIPVLEHIHNAALQNGTAATCTTAGFKDYYTCSCGLVFEDATCNIEVTDLTAWKAVGGNGYIAPKGHTYGEWTITKEPTETETGSKERTCSACGNKDTGIIPVLEHIHNVALQNGTAATCTTAGFKGYYTCSCGLAFEDATCNIEVTDLTAWKAVGGNGYLAPKGHTYGEWATTKEPTLTEKGMKERSCTACGDKQTEEIPVLTPVTYSIISGANVEWTKDSSDGLTFTSDADFAKFVCVMVDGAEIAATNYTAVSGSTKVTLTAAYLETLSVGSHTMDVVSNDGTASTSFTVKVTIPADPTNPTSPQTGDNSHMFLWIALLFISGGVLVGTTVYGRKKKNSAD